MLKLIKEVFVEHMGRVRRTLAIAAAAFALGGAGEAPAAVIFDNITGTSSPGGYVVGEYSPGSDYAIGWSFTVPIGAGGALFGGSIGVQYASGTNEMDLQIANDVGDTVGATVASAVIQNHPPVLGFVNFTMSPEVVLTPGASYWLLASMPDPNATAYWWTPNIAAAPNGFPEAVSYNGGVYGVGSNERPGQFSIVTVPEPSTWAMILVGFAGIAWIASRQRRTDAAAA
jgi:PEP-CTERM motif